MKASHACALAALFLIVWALLAVGCVHAPHRASIAPIGWTLPIDANPDDPFCVVILPGPLVAPGEAGMHCTTVQALRWWLSRLRAADEEH